MAYYLEKGYVYTGYRTPLFVKVEDLQAKSAARILVRCDMCGKEYTLEYCDYTRVCPNTNAPLFCKVCSKVYSKLLPLEVVHKWFTDRNYTPLFTHSPKAKERVPYICKTHPATIQHICYDKLNIGQGCLYCAAERVSGENHHNWKGGLSSEVMKIRTSPATRAWRISVFTRDNHTCRKCGTRGGNLNAHHIKNFSSNPNMRFTLSNGVTLCSKCHKAFHSRYGVKNNNEEQLELFLNH